MKRDLFINPIESFKERAKYSESYYDYWKIFRGVVDRFTNQLKYAWQRAWRGYDDPYKWNLGGEVAKDMLVVLKDYRHNRLGSPDISDSFDFEIPEDKTVHDIWDAVLDRMIAAFATQVAVSEDKYAVYDENGEFDAEASREKYQEMEQFWLENAELIIHYWGGLWD